MPVLSELVGALEILPDDRDRDEFFNGIGRQLTLPWLLSAIKSRSSHLPERRPLMAKQTFFCGSIKVSGRSQQLVNA